MIAVIADDLTGAAELGGLGLRYNLRVQVATVVDVNTTSDLLIIAADTRSVSEADAVIKIEKITKELIALQPQLIFKKIDSVLRGHVVAELKTQMKVMKLYCALVIPANPHLQRTIIDGHYYVKGEPLHNTSFSKDPEFPSKSSLVTDILRDTNTSVVKLHEALPSRGIAVGEVADISDLQTWAERVNANTVLAGGAGFFNEVLNTIVEQAVDFAGVEKVEFSEPILFVSGTTFNQSRQAIKKIKLQGGPVSYMPLNIIRSPAYLFDEYELWIEEIKTLLSTRKKAIVAIEESAASLQANANDLRSKIALVVNSVLKKVKVKELIVEGGSTAASIIREQNFTQLIPVQELSQGVIRMKVERRDDLHLTMKPGSYEWSEEISRVFNQ